MTKRFGPPIARDMYWYVLIDGLRASLAVLDHTATCYHEVEFIVVKCTTTAARYIRSAYKRVEVIEQGLTHCTLHVRTVDEEGYISKSKLSKRLV